MRTLILVFLFSQSLAQVPDYIEEQNNKKQWPVRSYKIGDGPEIEFPALIVLENDTLYIWQWIPTFIGIPSNQPYTLPIDPSRTITKGSTFVYLMASPWGKDNRVFIDDVFIELEIPMMFPGGKVIITRSRLRRWYKAEFKKGG